MAISRGAGTEIIRTVMLEGVTDAIEELIFGVQYHIYTVLSVIVHANALNAAGDYFHLYVLGYDALGGATAQNLNISHQEMQVQQTFVWNDKYSFMGHEPVDFTAGMDSVAKQDAIADQGSAVVQKLLIYGEHASDNFDVTCTFIDQNNA